MSENTRNWIIEHYKENQRSYDAPINRDFYSKIASLACKAGMTGGFVPKRIIDIGSGTGISASVVNQMFPEASIFTLDPSKEKSVTGRNIENVVSHYYCRLADMNVSEEFDLLICSMSYHWFDVDDKRALKGVATNAGTLVISTPTRRLSESLQNCLETGNLILKEVYSEMMEPKDISLTPREWRGIDLLKEEIDGFKIKSRVEVEMRESISGCDFGDVLHSRGLTLALFGPKALPAYEALKRKASSIEKVEISWPIGLIVAKRDQPLLSS